LAGFANSGGAVTWVIEHLAGSGEHPSLPVTESHGSFPSRQLPDYLGNPASVARRKPLDVLLVPATPVGWAKIGIGERLPAHDLYDPMLISRQATRPERDSNARSTAQEVVSGHAVTGVEAAHGPRSPARG
jgi:hypothetical protein